MNLNSGALLAVFSFILWGITPLFYRLIPQASAPELLAQRLFWSLPLLLLARLLLKHRTTFQQVWQDKKSLVLCLLAGLVMSLSWTAFTYALTHNQVLAASLGYFINPLVSILLGVILLREVPSNYQKIAVIFAVVGVGWQLWQAGTLPSLALLMGSAFAVYGFIRKFIRYDIVTALTLETLWLYPLAIGITVYMAFTGQGTLSHTDQTTYMYYILSAPVTIILLLFFAAAIKRTSLIVIGLAQYVEPTLQFLLAVFVFHEAFDQTKAVSFSLIWIGLLFCVYELSIRLIKNRLLAARQSSPHD
jgi:chloramphenicol-sensitive protein RarD